MDSPLYRPKHLSKEAQLAQIACYPDLLRAKEEGRKPLGNLMVEARKRHDLEPPPAWAAHVSEARYRGGQLQPNDQIADIARMTWQNLHWQPGRKPLPPQELLAQQEALCAEMTRWLDTYCPEQSAAALSVQDAPAPTPTGPEPYARLNADTPPSAEERMIKDISLSAHPVARTYRAMTPDEYAALKASIAAIGLLEPIVLSHDDPPRIIDGVHRHRACVELGVHPDATWIDPARDLQAYVRGRNEARRHMSEDERAAIDAKDMMIINAGAQKRSEPYVFAHAKNDETPIEKPEDIAAKRGVNVSSVYRAADKYVGYEDLLEDLAEGRKTSADVARERAERETQAKQEAEAEAQLARREAQEAERVARQAEARRADTLALEEKQQAQRDARDRRKVLTEANSRLLKQTLIRKGEEGKYAVVLADPPWDDPGAVTGSRSSGNHYQLADYRAIRDMDTSYIAADAILFLWSKGACLHEALEVMQAWGFRYFGLMGWVKPHIGMGTLFRNRFEPLLVGLRGKFRVGMRADKGVDGLFEAPAGEHSRKPEASYAAIERLFPDLPKIELFGRRTRPGWTVWGDEVE